MLQEYIGNDSPKVSLYVPGTYKVYSLLRLRGDYISDALECVHEITGPVFATFCNLVFELR